MPVLFNALSDFCLVTFLIHTTSTGLNEVIKKRGVVRRPRFA